MNPSSPILDNIPALAPDIPANAFAADNVLMATIAILAALVLLIGFILLLRSIRQSKRAAAPPLSPEALALAELARLEEELPPLRLCALKLSLILRGFLTGQTQDPALYETHEEFSLRIDSLSSLPESCQYDMRCLLETLAEQKYTDSAGQDNPTLARELITQARELVQRIAAAEAEKAAESPQS